MAKIHNGWMSRSLLSLSHRSVTNGCPWCSPWSAGSQSLGSLKMSVVIETEFCAFSIQEEGMMLTSGTFYCWFLEIWFSCSSWKQFSHVADITYSNCVCYTHNSRATPGPLQLSHSASHFIWGVTGGSKVLALGPDVGNKKTLHGFSWVKTPGCSRRRSVTWEPWVNCPIYKFCWKDLELPRDVTYNPVHN